MTECRTRHFGVVLDVERDCSDRGADVREDGVQVATAHPCCDVEVAHDALARHDARDRRDPDIGDVTKRHELARRRVDQKRLDPVDA